MKLDHTKIAVAVLLLTSLGIFNWRAHQRPGRCETAIPQLRFLDQELAAGAADRMQSLFPEGYVFTWSLYGLAWAQVAMSLPESDPLRDHALSAARNAVIHVTSEKAKSTFSEELTPPHGAFYSSWSLYLRSVLLRATTHHDPTPFVMEEFEQDAERFASALSGEWGPYLPSYPGWAWPADTVVGVAALAVRDSALPPRYGPDINRWLEMVRYRLDPGQGPIPHGPVFPDGSEENGPRGSSLALMSRVLADVDPTLAREQYELLRRGFLDYQWGVPGVREYPAGTDGSGDVDSGPLVLGYSGPATVVGVGAAIANGDDETADALLTVAEIAGFPVELAGKRRYVGGLVPIGDAFLAWSRSTPRLPERDRKGFERSIPRAWALPFHAISFVLACAILRAVLRPSKHAG